MNGKDDTDTTSQDTSVDNSTDTSNDSTDNTGDSDEQKGKETSKEADSKDTKGEEETSKEGADSDKGDSSKDSDKDSSDDGDTDDGDTDGTTERVVPKPEDYKIPEHMPDALRAFANKYEFTQGQLDASLHFFDTYNKALADAEFETVQKEGKKFTESWGEQEDYNLNLAKRALKQNDPDGKLTKLLNTSGYGNHPAVINFLYTLGSFMNEGGFLKSEVNRPPGKKSLAQKMYPDHPSNEL